VPETPLDAAESQPTSRLAPSMSTATAMHFFILLCPSQGCYLMRVCFSEMRSFFQRRPVLALVVPDTQQFPLTITSPDRWAFPETCAESTTHTSSVSTVLLYTRACF